VPKVDPRLLVVGGASLDILHFSGQTARSPGGAGLYTALAASRSGARVTMYAPRPEPMPEELRPALARLEWVGPTVRPEELPRFEIANYGEGRTEMRSLFWGAEERLRPEEAPDAEGGWLYCVPFADPALQLAFLRHFKARGTQVACGTYAPLTAAHKGLAQEAAALADAFFCNESEAATLFGGLDGARARPGRLLFVTRGASGARVLQGAHATDLRGQPARELDPTGAGDAFCGTVLAWLVRGAHPVEAARHALAQAAEAVEDVGPRALFREGPAPARAEDPRVKLDADRLSRVAAVLAEREDVMPFDFVGEAFPPVGDPRALDFFFAATLQQFGFWFLDADRWAGPLLASFGGWKLKGSDYLWAAYRRWMDDDPEGLRPTAQAGLDARAFAARLRADDGSLPLPDAGLSLEAARSYGSDMADLGLTPEDLVALGAASPSPVGTLLQRLDHVGGYKEDPLRKKSALLTLILRERPERFLPGAGEDVPPIVDYHVQRSLLRLGVIEVVDDALRKRLVARRLLEAADEEAVRRAAFRAMAALREASGKPMAACDYFLFQMRHRCPETREPECALCPADPACAHRKELFQPVRRTSFY
jgi:sugar/nucleoside kinase (ribokinase family)